MLDATDEYFEAEDALGRWLEERCVRHPNAKALTAELFSDWKQWAEAAGEFVGSQKRFADLLLTRGLEKWRNGMGLRGFQGDGPQGDPEGPLHALCRQLTQTMNRRGSDGSDRLTDLRLCARTCEESNRQTCPIRQTAQNTGLTNMTTTVLALDLGSQLGWALSARDGLINGGSENFRLQRFEGGGFRYLRFKRWLTEIK